MKSIVFVYITLYTIKIFQIKKIRLTTSTVVITSGLCLKIIITISNELLDFIFF